MKLFLLFFAALLGVKSSLCWVPSATQCRRHLGITPDSRVLQQRFLEDRDHRLARSAYNNDGDDEEDFNFGYGSSSSSRGGGEELNPDAYEDDDDDEDEDEVSDEELLATMGEWDDRVPKFNTLHLIGRVGSDPQPRYFDDGNVVVNLSLACQRKYHYLERQAYNIKYGEEETVWFRLEIWGAQAEFVSKFVEKGTRVAVTGRLEIDEWQDKQSGEMRSAAKVIVREFDVIETKAESDLRRGKDRRSRSFYQDDPDGPDEYDPNSGSSGGFFR